MVADGAVVTKRVCSPIPPVLPYGTGMDPFIYQYAVGGVIFAIGLVYAARQGYIGFRGARLRNLVILIGGETVVQSAPLSYQSVDGESVLREVEFEDRKEAEAELDTCRSDAAGARVKLAELLHDVGKGEL